MFKNNIAKFAINQQKAKDKKSYADQFGK